jgi:parallel beta-helix repeat protein
MKHPLQKLRFKKSPEETSKVKKRIHASLIFVLLLASMPVALWKLSAKAESVLIYIRSDGSVDPPTAPIQQSGDLYTFTTNISGFVFVQKDNIVIDGNSNWLQGNGAGYGFDLTGRDNVTIMNCSIKGFCVGIHMYFSSNVVLMNNHVGLNEGGGFQILSSQGTHMINNELTRNGGNALWVSASNEIIISGNLVTDNYAGITIVASSVFMRNNSISRNSYNFGVEGEVLSHFVSDIDTSNTINDRPIYYLMNSGNMEIPPNAGYVAAVNSTGIIIRNLTLVNNENGVLLGFSSNSIVENVSASSNNYGIQLFESSNNSITNCNLQTNYCAIRVQNSTNNNITWNQVISNWYGIRLIESSGNRVYHNSFSSYTKQADADPDSTDIWDDGYPAGGNHWSDYKGVDLNQGYYQNMTGSDGIGDTPYVINTINRDNFPLMEPWNPKEDKTPPKINGLSRTPDSDVPAGQEVTVRANVTDAESGVKNVTLSYRQGNASSWNDLPMHYNVTLGLYEAVIPSQLNQTSVLYEITAFDNVGNIAWENDAGQYHVYSVTPEQWTLTALFFLMAVSALVLSMKRKHDATKSS